MRERVAGKLSGCDFRPQSGLHRREVVDIAEQAAIALAAFFDGVLPEAADQRACRIVESRAEIGKGRRCAATASGSAVATSASASASTGSAVAPSATAARIIRRH